MKRVALIATVPLLLVLGIVGYNYGDRLLTKRHRVTDFKWKLPPEKPVTLSDSLAVEGIQLALRSSSRDPANWQPVPVTDNLPGSILRKGNNPNAGLVVLSNSNSAAQLYARVELDPTNRALNVAISHPK